MGEGPGSARGGEVKKPHQKWDCPCTDCQRWYRDEVKRLREAIEKAPHGLTADGVRCKKDLYKYGTCTCWKRAALAGAEEKS
jgi:hypothetical protein